MISAQPSSSPPPRGPAAAGPFPELRLKLLGAPQIAVGPAPLSFKRRKAVALLAYLALSGRLHSREALASLLAAEDADDAQAKTQLRNTLYALGGQVGDYLLLTREAIGLHPARPLWVDALELQRAVLAAGAPGADTGALARAVALYEGALLAGFTIHEAPEFEEWLLRERQRLQGLLGQGLALLLARAQEQGDTAATLGWATRLLAEEPWREEGHRALMRGLARRGQRGAALAQYATCRRVLAEQLGRAPQAATEALYAQLRAEPTDPPHNLALPAAACVGREQELALLRQRLEDPACRVLTLLGLGGSGKTCLALAAAAHYVHPPALSTLLDQQPFPDGVFLVRLPGAGAPGRREPNAGPETARRLALALGRVLGLNLGTTEDPTAQLLAWLRPKTLLLVVDNGEQLKDGVALIRALVRQAPGVTVLVTSRKRLQVPEEWVVELGGLALPCDADHLEQAGASQLFVQQMRQVGMTGPLTVDDRSHVVRICQMTQGLPLALVLAARWRRGLSCSAIAAELAQGLDVLETTDRAVPERHRSVRAVLETSWEELTEDEQVTLRRLAVCQGGFTRAAARAVAGAGQAQVPALQDRALLRGDERQRLVVHELVQRYAAEQLASRPEEEQQVRARHAAYYAGFIEQHAAALVQTPQARDAISREMANVRAAWEWALAHRDVDLLMRMRRGLVAWYELTGAWEEWSQVMGRAVGAVRTAFAAAGETGHATAGVLCSLLVDEARGRIAQGQYDRALAILQEADVLAQESRLLHLEADTAYHHGQLLYRQGRMEAARPQLEQALALARTAGVPDIEGRTLGQLGRLCVSLAEYPQAQDYCTGALPIYQALGDRVGEATARCELGTLAYEQGHFAVARTCFEESLRGHRLLGYRIGERCAVNGLSLVLDEGLGCYTEADAYVAQALAIAQELGDRQGHAQALVGQGRHALRQGDLIRARTAFAQALTIGQGGGAEESVALALWGLGLVAHYEGDERHAFDHAQQAVGIAQERRQRRSERFALRLLGHAVAGLGQLTQATIIYQRVLQLDRALGYRHLAVETTADLARVALAQADLERAYAYVAAIVDHLKEQGAAGTEEPVLLYLTCYQVLRGRHDHRAEDLLAAGHALLHDRAGQFEDVERRTMFLANPPSHRALRSLWRHGRDLRGIAAMQVLGVGGDRQASAASTLALQSLVR